MNKGEFRDYMMDWLNRPDLTTANADRMVDSALGRLSREVRLPMMERSVPALPDATGKLSYIRVPPLFLEAQRFEADGLTLRPVTVDRLLTLPARPGTPEGIARVADRFMIRPYAQQYALLHYWAAFDPLVADTDTNALLESNPEVLLWGTLSYAADFFRMDELAVWEQRYAAERDALKQLAQDADLGGAPNAVSPMFTGDYM